MRKYFTTFFLFVSFLLGQEAFQMFVKHSIEFFKNQEIAFAFNNDRATSDVEDSSEDEDDLPEDVFCVGLQEYPLEKTIYSQKTTFPNTSDIFPHFFLESTTPPPQQV